MEFGTPEMEFGAPEMEFGVPEMQFGTPEIEFGSKKMEFGSQVTPPGEGNAGLNARVSWVVHIALHTLQDRHP